MKLYQKFTHPNDRPRDKAPVRAGGRRRVQGAASSRSPPAGRLGPLLAQFPASFKDTPEARDYLRLAARRRFADYPLAVELRHKSWSDDVATRCSTCCDEHGAAWTQIDEPKFRFSIRQDLMPNVKTFYYMRLHGRNAEQWWEHEQSEDRYNYLYSESELQPFAGRGADGRALVKKQYVYLNNHFAAQAIADAAVLRHLLDEPVDSADARRARGALSDARGQGRLRCPLHGYSDDAIADAELVDHVHARR